MIEFKIGDLVTIFGLRDSTGFGLIVEIHLGAVGSVPHYTVQFPNGKTHTCGVLWIEHYQEPKRT